jgi:ParB-like chromosome segregation protein Spo0J
MSINNNLKNISEQLLSEISKLNDCDKIEAINQVKLLLHEASPLKNEPVDCVLWVKAEKVKANDYNPNKVAPPEMELLKVSVLADGFTQPIVTFPEAEQYTVIDGFHRNRVGKEDIEVKTRIKGYLPITIIRPSQEDKGDRIASTIRHNRARGKHQIQGMSAIVLELKRRNWSDNKIAKNLGMDADEILRLTQISGLKEMFKDQEFSLSWEATNNTTELDIDEEEIQK